MARLDVALWWIRRDLRLHDNQALSAALREARQVVPVFVLEEPSTSRCLGDRQADFQTRCLRNLDSALRERGSRLLFRRGDVVDELLAVAGQTGAGAAFTEAGLSPCARREEADLAERLTLRLVGTPVLHGPGTVVKADGDPYVVYSPFRRKWRNLPIPRQSDPMPAPTRIETPDLLPGTVDLLSEAQNAVNNTHAPGELVAMEKLKAFTSGPDPAIYRYSTLRDRCDTPGTSDLSPYLRFGLIGARQAFAAVQAAIADAPDDTARSSAETWLAQLIWREFYFHIMVHFPYVLETSFRPALAAVNWRNDVSEFAAWCEGRTGYPIVDAAMCQLTGSGWMHNRARMIAASFLVKDLLIDWRWGERFFMQHLIDGDPAANNGGWQWTAGTGTDAAPYFRVFNPTRQGKKHDPDGRYVRKWLPALARVPAKLIHEPWRMSQQEQQDYGCVIGRDYPPPIVDHLWARERALEVYAQAREGNQPIDE